MTLEIERLVRFNIIYFIILVSTLFCQHHPNAKIDSILNKGIEEIIDQRYDNAALTFTSLDSLFPNNPLGNIYLAATEISKSVDYEENINSDLLDSLLNNAMDITKSLLDEDDTNLWYNYYQALIYGYKAYYSAISGSIISSFSDGVESLEGFQNCLEIDENFNEAFIALGTYKYWKSAQVKSLSWIPFISDNREEGISLLEKSLDSFSYNKYLAAYSLIWIYIDYNKSDNAVKLALTMLKEYPGSRFFRWGLARAYEDIDKSKAVSVYSEILALLETLPDRNQFNDIVLKHKMAMLLNKLNQNKKSLQLCDEILDFQFNSAEIKERLTDRIERVKKLKEQLKTKLESSKE